MGDKNKKKTKRKEKARIRKKMAALVEHAREAGSEAIPGEALEVEMPLIPTPVRRSRGPQKAPTKTSISIRLDRDVLTALRKDGPGWQTRLNATLRDSLGLDAKNKI